MLRVTTSADAGKTSFKLEGKLAGSWVDVMEQCWRRAVAEGVETPMIVDLSAITYVDARGTELLRQMHNSGVQLRSATCLGKGLVEQVKSCSGELAEDQH
jgi:anti-anti-sigma regulatory factor